MWNLPCLIVLSTSSMHWSAVLGTQYASIVLRRDLPLFVVTSSFMGECQTKFKQTQTGTAYFVLFFIDNKSTLCFPDSCQVNPQTASHQSPHCHSAVGMLFPWFSCLGPDAFKELRFSSLLMMSVHVFLYWCRSREYTKGSQAALL